MSRARRIRARSAVLACASTVLVALASGQASAAEWQGCEPLSVTAQGGTPHRLTGLEVRQASCGHATEIARGFYSQEIGSSGAAEVEGFGCAYRSAGDRVLCISKTGNSYTGPERVRWRQEAQRSIDPAQIATCSSFTVFKGYSKYTGRYKYRASSIERSAAISCSMTRKLLKAAYHQGPLQVVRTVYPFPNRSGRPIYWLRGGWRCSNGAGGAACWNPREPPLNAIPVENLAHGLAVSAEVGYAG